MNWQQVREVYPQQWVLAEVLKGHSVNKQWIVDQLTIVNTYTHVSKALEEHKKLHQQMPEREYFVVHTKREQLEIFERHWVGIRDNS
jgi:hypothetical protein